MLLIHSVHKKRKCFLEFEKSKDFTNKTHITKIIFDSRLELSTKYIQERKGNPSTQIRIYYVDYVHFVYK